MHKRRSGRDGRSGQALVETALALPILLLLTFVIIDGGRAFYTRNVINNIARDEARILATDPRLNPNYTPPNGTRAEAINTAIADTTARITARLALADGVSLPPSQGFMIQVNVPGVGGVTGSIRDNPVEVRISRSIPLVSGSLLPIPGVGAVDTTVSSSAFVEKSTESGDVSLNLPLLQDLCNTQGVCTCLTRISLCSNDELCTVHGACQPDERCRLDPLRCTQEQGCRLHHTGCTDDQECQLYGLSCDQEQDCRFNHVNCTDDQDCLFHRLNCDQEQNCRWHNIGCLPDQRCQLDPLRCTQEQKCRLNHVGCTDNQECQIYGLNCDQEQDCRFNHVNCTDDQNCRFYRVNCDQEQNCRWHNIGCLPDQRCQLDPSRCTQEQKCRLNHVGCTDDQNCRIHGLDCDQEQDCRLNHVGCTEDQSCIYYGTCEEDQLCRLVIARCADHSQLCRVHPEDPTCAIEG